MKKKKPKKENSERWLLTYSDLITLLMIFFVVMYAMSNVDTAKYSQASESLKGVFSGTQYVIGEGGNPGIDAGGETGGEISKNQQLQEDMKVYLEKNNLKDKVEMKVEPRGLVITLKDNVFFQSGDATLLSQYKENILAIGNMLGALGHDIVVEGHTDNMPIHNGQFKSNWDLAAMRAINVIDLLVSAGKVDPSKLSAVSYGEFKPLASNDTPEGRAKNRRIDMVILSGDFYKESQKAK